LVASNIKCHLCIEELSIGRESVNVFPFPDGGVYDKPNR
jgi:hypothetical protein